MAFWTKGNGTTYENLDRSFAATIADQGQTVWFALLLGLCNSKNLAAWLLAGLTTDATGTNDANLFETTANGTPSPFRFGSTALFTGDTSFTPHLVLVKLQMSGNTNAETMTAYCDPNLSTNPDTWTGVVRSNLYANNGIAGFAYRGGRASTTTPNTQFLMDEIRLATTWQAAIGRMAPPPQITAIQLANATNLVLQWQSVPGTTYKIQAATNLLTGFYDTSLTNIVATNSITSRTVSVGPSRTGFYRVGVLP
jgi:hypothetical protein